ncbi:hypothetical protein P154DRAFT_522978 [Amniculicola lignicola CBS 123094]|uniref:RING-type E3 ubiquitin transferase n=1 Tax=Amniculicola lignicola CBS 123094 TaxID=1392246 RepID=A0A6A5WQP3_9PLEO|nr:hypothetical protein P154DRAFT_522978 [Amniculicola lignicola CBS 123094]
MFTTGPPSAATVSASPVSTTSAPLPRPSRLRGLSYIRNNLHGLHSHAAADSSRADARTTPDPVPPTAPKSNHRPRATTAATATPPIPPLSVVPSAGAARGGLSRTHTAPESSERLSTDPSSTTAAEPSTSTTTMTRNRAETTAPQLTVRNHSGPIPTSTPSASAMDVSGGQPDDAPGKRHLPSIRFIPHQDPRAGRPSLQFPTITRTLPDEAAIIRVGRYSERDNLPDIPANVPSAAAVGFKSKVVSRKHCELWCKESQWYIKDVKSSSGTFLNHIRLSQPNVESKPFKIKDGDIIQLGIDFRGGEEMIFRCVKIRIECNRGWQQALNTFNKQTHQRLRNLAKKKDSDSASTHSSECSICLMSIAPCQSLFVAPCSHVWHYKCIRPILNGPTWPNFLCPNCRAVTDLEAEVDDPGDFEIWDDEVAESTHEPQANGTETNGDRHVTPRTSTGPLNQVETNATQTNGHDLAHLQNALSNITIGSQDQPAPDPATPHRFLSAAPSSVTQPVSINLGAANDNPGLSPLFRNGSAGLSPDQRAPECPMTPRNDAGPFVLDGSAGRASAARSREESPSRGNTDAPLPPIQFN